MAKTNKAMRAASGLLVLTLLSTCMISGTFAKYVTNDTSHDSARVAKFGAKVVSFDNTAFDKVYKIDDTGVAGIINSVEAQDNVLAPGTEKSLTAVKISGTNEVAVNIQSEAKLTANDADWTVNGTFYCPIVFTIGNAIVDGKTATSISDLQSKINDALDQYDGNFKPGVDLGTDAAKCAPAISWKWPFYYESDSGDNNDAKDTTLGEAGTASFGIDVTTTVTQID